MELESVTISRFVVVMLALVVLIDRIAWLLAN